MSMTLNKLRDVIEERRGTSHKVSYVAKLFKQGRGKICQKIGEESAEVIVAALSQEKNDVVEESADLLFHLSMLWADTDVTPDEVMKVLVKRMSISGLDEKAARTSKKKDKKKSEDKKKA